MEAKLEDWGMVDYSTAPIQSAVPLIKRYVENHIAPGGFFTALFANHISAVVRADPKNYEVIREWVRWVHGEMPREIVGSQENVTAHLNRRFK
jgi:hypothetical protein